MQYQINLGRMKNAADAEPLHTRKKKCQTFSEWKEMGSLREIEGQGGRGGGRDASYFIICG